jgi:hypothetical protein
VARDERHELTTHHLKELMRTVQVRTGIVLHDGREGLIDPTPSSRLQRKTPTRHRGFAPVL